MTNTEVGLATYAAQTYAYAIGQIESLLGIVGPGPLDQTVERVRALRDAARIYRDRVASVRASALASAIECETVARDMSGSVKGDIRFVEAKAFRSIVEQLDRAAGVQDEDRLVVIPAQGVPVIEEYDDGFTTEYRVPKEARR